VRNIFLLFIILSGITNCSAQDTVEQKNRLTDSVTERFYVLKSDPEIKQGSYKAFFRRKTLIASGSYIKNVKAGTWQFYDSGGKLVEKFNYNNKTFVYEAPLYATDDLSYLLDDTINKGDKLTGPIKPGGIYYGYIPYVNLFQLPFNMTGVDTYDFEAYIELLISPLGKLADYNVRVVSPNYEYDQSFDIDVNLFSEEDRTFQPATLNGKPVLSRIIINCLVTGNGRLEFY
jgi:hypothetical protein